MKREYQFWLLLLIGFSIMVVSGCESRGALTPKGDTQAETPVIVRTMTSTTTSTSTVMPSPTATLTPTLSADQLLDVRYPTEEQIWTYLEKSGQFVKILNHENFDWKSIKRASVSAKGTSPLRKIWKNCSRTNPMRIFSNNSTKNFG